MTETTAPLLWIASGMGAVILAGGGAWAGWMSIQVIGLVRDMAVVKRRLKLNGKGG